MLQSRLIPYKHGFFTRFGGVSRPPYDSLNVAMHVDDDKAAVERNRAIVCKSLASEVGDLVFLGKLGHSNKIVKATKSAAGKEFKDYDAVMTEVPGLLLGLSVADCLPILIADKKARVVAAVHAGWRGLLAEVIPMTIEAIYEEYGVEAEDLTAVIGPAIKQESYEVGEDVYKHFSERYLLKKHNSVFLSIDKAALDQLNGAGVREVGVIDVDTFTDSRFYSYRRNSDTGRFFAGISL